MTTRTADDEAAKNLTTHGRRLLDRAAERMRVLEALAPPFTLARVGEPLNDLLLDVSNVESESSLLAEVHPRPSVREAAEELSREAQQFSTRLLQSRPLYDALSGIDEASLDPVALRFVQLMRQDMRRMGVDLREADRQQVSALRDELVKVEQDFSRNIRDAVRQIVLDGPADLDGLPADYVAAHAPDTDGRITITTNYPDYIPFMAYARGERARKALLFESENRAVPENLALLDQMLAKRHTLANLLGYPTWAAYATEDKMTGSPETVSSFIAQAYDATRESGAAELRELVARKRQDDPAATTVGEWELSFQLERLKAERFDFDARAVRPYFEYERVKQAILGLTSELFGLSMTRVDDPDAWHPSVETYEIAVDGVPMGRFSLDMHPREGKYKHAACFTRQRGVGGKQLPHKVLVCNFPDPAAQPGPALMEHREVVTFFHEFGHLVHGIVSGAVPWVRLGAVSEWDFVEAPSQFLEEWIYDFEVLRRFARHVDTGETIPAELVQKLRAARDFGRGIHVQRQLFFAAISLTFHDRDPRGLDTTAMVRELAKRYAPFELLPGTHFQASFGHLEGYTALYYTYMWSLVISKDLHSAFAAGGLLDVPNTRRYRDAVLAPGGTKPAAQVVADFLGRPYNFEAFRRWLAPAARPA